MTRILLAGLLTAFTGLAVAQTPAPAPQDEPDRVATGEPMASDVIETAQPARTCLQSTGSRITIAQNQRAEREGSKQRSCATATGRAYTKDDLNRSGHMTIHDALRSLDTSIR